MNYAGRIKHLEKKTSRGNGEVHIEVSRVDSPEFEEKYALFQARKVLGLVSFDEQQRHIFVCGPGTKARYEDMPPEQAKKILSTGKDFSYKKKAGDVNK